MPKRHVMTAKRRMALRKAQLASARKRRRKGLKNTSPQTKKIVKYAAVGLAGYSAYRAAYVPVYHNTSINAAQGIINNGFKGSTVYVSVGRNRTKQWGPAIIKGRISRRQLYKVAHIDPEFQRRGYRYINVADMDKVHGVHIKRKIF